MRHELKGLKICWLDPLGNIVTDSDDFDDQRSWHRDLALCILRDKWKMKTKGDAFRKIHNEYSGFMTSTDVLEEESWVRLHSFANKSKWIQREGTRLTTSQKRVICDWHIANEIKFDTGLLT